MGFFFERLALDFGFPLPPKIQTFTAEDAAYARRFSEFAAGVYLRADFVRCFRLFTYFSAACAAFILTF